MWQTLTTDYRRAGRAALAAVFGGTLALSAALTALAYDGSFEGGGQVSGDAYTYAAAPYAVSYQDAVYEYATGEDGKGYYTVYDGQAYSEWAGWDDQPADYQWEPVACVSGDWNYVFYAGTDGHLYWNGYDGAAWSGWEDVAGEYEFAYAPYAYEYDDAVHLYGAATDGNVYYKSYDGTEWTEWAAINDEYLAGAYQPYAVEWGDYDNVFWTGEDGKVYWNRYDGTEWTGARDLPYEADEYEYAAAPYAIGYSEDDSLYAYAVSAYGVPYWNVFDGEAWTGWAAYEAEFPATAQYQPSAYEYEGVQHLVVAADDGHAYYTTYDGAYGEWEDLGENYTYDPHQYAYGDGLYLTYTGTDG